MILVTGATGFLGKRVCKKLKDLNHEFKETSLSLGLDLRDEDETVKKIKEINPDYIINCAAYLGGVQFGYEHPADMFYNNMKMEISLLQACKEAGVTRLINPIGNCSYPGDAEIYTETEFWNGPLHESVAAYGLVKKAFCVGSDAYCRQHGLDVINLVFPNLYGPGDHFNEVRSHAIGALIFKFVNAVENNLPSVTVWGSGAPIREWLYVDDGCEALIRAMQIESYSDIINVGVNRGYSIKETAEMLKEITRFKGGIIYDTTKIDGALCKKMDGSRCKDLLNWSPQVPFEEGLRNTVEWYKEHTQELRTSRNG